jgi:hypothetical protein
MSVAALALLLPFLGDGNITVRRRDTPADVLARRVRLAEGKPALRGFRPDDVPVALDEPMRRAAALVQTKLARDGLVATAAAAAGILGSDDPSKLAAIGIPADLLAFFDRGTGAFTFEPTLAGFRASSESGDEAIGLARLQITNSTYFLGQDDGGSVDVVRQLLAALPDATFFASIEEKHVDGFLEVAKGWPGRLTLVPEALPVSQWAQDDGKPGTADGVPVLLLPRYASRGEVGASLVPGDTFVGEGLAAAGLRVVRSPLLFQGGDLLVARDPKTGERILFVGEGNVWRNTALGLTREQVLDAFRTELGVDRCTMLPAISFHVDEELSVRAVGGRLVAFVPDAVAAVRIVLRCGVEALEKAGVVAAAGPIADLEAGRDAEFLERVLPPLLARCPAYGRFPESLASAFSRGSADSGVGNLQRFLLATDLLTSWTTDLEHPAPSLDPHAVAYLRSFVRRDAERRDLAATLRKAGLDVVRIPSLPEEKRGIDYLNGVHDRGRYLMPAWGGLYAPLDDAARAAFAKALGPDVAVVPILTSESQRRGGGVHCSLSASGTP